MVKKIFGWLFIIAGAGNLLGFLVSLGASSDKIPSSGPMNPTTQLGYGAAFLCLGIFLVRSGKTTKENNS